MYHPLPRSARFWAVLFAIDQDLAETTRNAACSCRGPLHVADYPRKPRGGPDNLPDSYRWRLSFCCAREGCRKRVTPPSVRFLGPKVYLGLVVILLSTLRQGATPRAARELSRRFGADRRTIARWQVFWRDQFPETEFWKLQRARLTATIEIVELPRSMVQAFGSQKGRRQDRCTRLLRFLSPLTVAGALRVRIAMGLKNPQKLLVAPPA